MAKKNVIFDKKNVLVVGGAGFIGSHLCDELVKDCKVICVDNFISGDEKNIDHLLAEPDFEFIRHDITSPLKLADLPELSKFKIEFQGVQEVYNLACPMSPKDFDKNRVDILLANSYGTKNALDLAVEHGAKFVHFSSSVVYGQKSGDATPIAEYFQGSIDLGAKTACYDEGKRFAEAMVATYAEKFKLDTRTIRLFRVYGPRMKLGDGQMIPDFIDSAIDNRDLAVFGDERFSSSFCYVSDCVDAVIKLKDSDISTPINIGSDVRVNLTDLAKRIIRLLDSDSKITYTDKLDFMRPLLTPDISKARNELGWLPIVTLDKGLERTIYELQVAKGLKGVERALE